MKKFRSSNGRGIQWGNVCPKGGDVLFGEKI